MKCEFSKGCPEISGYFFTIVKLAIHPDRPINWQPLYLLLY